MMGKTGLWLDNGCRSASLREGEVGMQMAQLQPTFRAALGSSGLPFNQTQEQRVYRLFF